MEDHGRQLSSYISITKISSLVKLKQVLNKQHLCVQLSSCCNIIYNAFGNKWCPFFLLEHMCMYASSTRVGWGVMGLHVKKMTNRPFSVRLPTVIGAGRRRRACKKKGKKGKQGTDSHIVLCCMSCARFVCCVPKCPCTCERDRFHRWTHCHFFHGVSDGECEIYSTTMCINEYTNNSTIKSVVLDKAHLKTLTVSS